jgi:hypothetical protein
VCHHNCHWKEQGHFPKRLEHDICSGLGKITLLPSTLATHKTALFGGGVIVSRMGIA